MYMIYICIFLYIYIYIYIYKYICIYELNDKLQCNENCKIYIQVDQLKEIKMTKGRFKRNVKML